METAGLVIYISLANNLAERKMGATMGKEAPGSLKNLPTKMTRTQSDVQGTSYALEQGKLYDQRLLSEVEECLDGPGPAGKPLPASTQ